MLTVAAPAWGSVTGEGENDTVEFVVRAGAAGLFAAGGAGVVAAGGAGGVAGAPAGAAGAAPVGAAAAVERRGSPADAEWFQTRC